jgi:membrane protein
MTPPFPPDAPLESKRNPASPLALSRRGWGMAARRVVAESVSNRIGLAAAGCAFWGTLALFPALSTLISLYGLMFNPFAVERQLGLMRDFLPPGAFAMIVERVHTLVHHRHSTLGLSLLIGTALALWSASTGTKSMISALNMVHGARERRGLLRFQATGLLLTLGAVAGAILAITLLVGLPVAIDFLGLRAHMRRLLNLGALAVLVVFVSVALSVLYRFGPCRPRPRWHWATPGSALATALWLAASTLFSFYVGHLAHYDATYGPLGAVAGVMMWFWVTAYVVLIGAQLNAELEREAGGA